MYETAIKLARQHFDELLTNIIKTVRETKPEFYNELDDAELKRRISPTLEKHLYYLETGDLSDWKEYCTRIVTLRVKDGQNYGPIIQVNKLLLGAWHEFFEAKLLPLGTIDGQRAERIVRSIDNRLNGLDSVGIATATATALKLKQEQQKR
jgi:hypothetical protein